jgi:hypothetical protein
MHPAALPPSADEHRADRGLEAEVVVGDHELHAAQAAGAESLEERGSEGAILRVTDVDTEDLSVAGGGHAGGDDHGAGHDPTPDPALQVGGDPAAVGGGVEHLHARVGHVAGGVEAGYGALPGRVDLDHLAEARGVPGGPQADGCERLGPYPEPGGHDHGVGIERATVDQLDAGDATAPGR